MNQLIQQTTPTESDLALLKIVAAVRAGKITWSQGDALKQHVQRGNIGLAIDLLAAWGGC
jgi:hypothetical protein